MVGISIDGQWLEEVAEVKKGIFEFFQKHFQREDYLRPTLAADFTEKTVSNVDNEFLVAPFSEEEIKEEVWSCDGSKSPGLDGFNFSVLKELWSSLKTDVMRMMDKFHEHGRLVKGINPSFIVLIPKKEEAAKMKDFRSISLIGGIYKIISKVLAKRLSSVLDSVISENQSAFVGGRQILDCISVLNEAVDETKKWKLERIFFKIDFAKAYDTVDWETLISLWRGSSFIRSGGIG